LGFLGLGPFGRETLVYEGWKGLDFLGFSRPDQAFSMGYAGFSLNEISRALLPPRQKRGNGCPRFGLCKGMDQSWGNGNSISAFLQ
jgi:hypothetical protein